MTKNKALIFHERVMKAISLYLIVLRLGKEPRKGFLGSVGRFFNLPFGWVSVGLSESEFTALITLAKKWKISLHEDDAV